MSTDDLFFDMLTAPLQVVVETTTPHPTPEPVVLAQEPPCVVPDDVVVSETPDGMFVQSNGQLGFVEEHITDRQYATLTAFESLTTVSVPVVHGQRYRLCGRHWLVIASVVEPPHVWAALLDGMVGFVPWPDILVADHFGPDATPVVFVQPDLDIAGTILSFYQHRYGADCIQRIA